MFSKHKLLLFIKSKTKSKNASRCKAYSQSLKRQKYKTIIKFHNAGVMLWLNFNVYRKDTHLKIVIPTLFQFKEKKNSNSTSIFGPSEPYTAMTSIKCERLYG